MIATRTLMRRSGPRIAKSLLNQQGVVLSSVHADRFIIPREPQPLGLPSLDRHFSTFVDLQIAEKQGSAGKVSKTLRVLDMDVVKTILEELRSVDVNSDGRYEKNNETDRVLRCQS